MTDSRIEVAVYEGRRSAERPRSFQFEGRDVEVAEILRTWVQEEHATRVQRRFFTVTGSDGARYTLYYDCASMEWFFRSRETQGEGRS